MRPGQASAWLTLDATGATAEWYICISCPTYCWSRTHAVPCVFPNARHATTKWHRVVSPNVGLSPTKSVHVWTQVYLPMSYVYGKRGTCKETPLTAAIRGELYPQSYSSIDWNAARNQCAKEDLYYPHPKVLNHFLCAFKFVI